MTEVTWSLNLLMGVVYLVLGTLLLVDLLRGWSTLGFSHFGAGIIAVAFTCGFHHLDHAGHLVSSGATGGGLDGAATAIGLPIGATWAWLRVEAWRGGAGDRLIAGDPPWLRMVPFAGGAYAAVLLVRSADWIGSSGVGWEAGVAPNALLVPIYLAIAWVLVRTQVANRKTNGGWSLSGLSLAGIFLTCAPMHGSYSLYLATGLYPEEGHLTVIGWAAVAAGLYFLWIVRALYRDARADWHRHATTSA